MAHTYARITGHPAFIRTASLLLLALLALICWAPLGCSVGAATAGGSSIAKEQAAEATGVLPAQFFGMVVKNPATQLGIPVGARRLWDSGVTWAALEPATGVFDWSTLDAEVNAAGGAPVTLTLGMTPTWASSQPGIASSYGAGATAMPAYLSDWDVYVRAVAARYAGRIQAYEVWNAPEDPTYWSGAPAQMGVDLTTLAAHAFADVHGADPAAVVVSPALSPAGLAAFVTAGGGSSIDVIGVALETAGQAPESAVATLAAVRGALSGTSADGKPIWDDGGSWVVPQGEGDAQPAYVARALILNAGYGVARMHWYAWDATDAGALLLTDAQGSPTAAAAAYAVAERWLGGAQINGCAATGGGVWTCQLVRGGALAWILWSPAGTVSSSSLGASTMTDLQGNTTPVSSTVSVGASPVLLQ